MFQFKGSTYLITRMANYSWTDAELFCSNIGGHLWSINSHEEWEQLYDHRATTIYDDYRSDLNHERFDPMYYEQSFIGLIRDKNVSMSI